MSLAKHPDFTNIVDMIKWRYAYAADSLFMDKYLKTFSSRETADDFATRKCVSYVPRFARSDLDEVKDAIYQRMADIGRLDGPRTYSRAVAGIDGGVDLLGNSMNSFIGQFVLLELVLMGRVGVYVDMPDAVGETLADGYQRPYLYMYTREQIENWVVDPTNPGEFTNVRLCDEYYKVDEEGFPIELAYRRRQFRKVDGGVQVRFLDTNGKDIEEPKVLPLTKIPFVCMELSDSLMAAVADYQIALMNLASSDLGFLLKANFPFYTEQVDARLNSPFIRQGGDPDSGTDADSQGHTKNIKIGVVHGREYALGADRPDFIHPSPEPLKASMEKQEQIKNEMRQVLKLKIASTSTPARVSKESKEVDERTLENGLSAIGLELERGERLIGEIWAQYVQDSPPTIHYPTNYSLRSDADRREECTDLDTLKSSIPSKTYQKEVSKRMARTLLGNTVSLETIEAIEAEIDAAPALSAKAEEIVALVDAAVLDPETAATILCFPAGTAAKAADASAERAARILEAQMAQSDAKSAARGVPDAGVNKDAGSDEKVGKPKRGPGK